MWGVRWCVHMRHVMLEISVRYSSTDAEQAMQYIGQSWGEKSEWAIYSLESFILKMVVQSYGSKWKFSEIRE